MATWTSIADTTLEPGKPGRSVDALALRDNPIAIAEGATGAPRIDGAISPAIRNGGVPSGELGAEKFQTGTTERDWVLGRNSSADAGAVGSYAFLIPDVASGGTVTINFGDTLSGSALTPCGIEDDVDSYSDWDGAVSSGAVSGTWRCMGFSKREPTASQSASRQLATLWLRIA